MEGNLRPPPPPPPNIGCHPELDRPEIENGKGVRRRSPDATPDGCTTWTEEKHNSYLRHLEVSFVKQLRQSKATSALAKCSEQRRRDVNIIPLKGTTNVRDSSEQFNVLRNGCWQRNNYIRDSIRELRSTVKLRKKTISPGFATPSHEGSSSDAYLGDLFDIGREEGTGQNFLDGVDQRTTKFVSQAKRSKKEFVDGSSQAISSIGFC